MPTYPLLKPALRRGWRDLDTVQFGVAEAHAVVLGPVGSATAAFLTLLDGTRGRELLRHEARRIGLPEGRADAFIERLAAAGLLDTSTGGGPGSEELRRRGPAMERLRSDHATLSVIERRPGGALRRLAARRACRVQVRGAGRTGAMIAALLAGAGVGRVDVLDGGRVEPWEVAPGGHPPEAVGERRADSARRVARRAAPGRPPRPRRRAASEAAEPAAEELGPEPPLALVIGAPRDGLAVHAPDPAAWADLVMAGVPHLYAGVVEGTAVVGPLVLPGLTACAGCAERGRAVRDPAWPRLLAQWRSGTPRQVPPCDLALAATVAGLATAHALALLDGAVPASAGTRWEASLPYLEWRSRASRPHPGCPCGAAPAHTGTAHPSEDSPAHDTMTA